MTEIADPPSMPRSWPHFGRAAEFAAAHDVVTGRDDASAVFLTGEPGVGKSFLADQVVRAVPHAVHVVALTTPSRPQPQLLAAVAPLLSDLRAGEATSPVAVFHAAADHLERCAEGREVVLRVEDCHLLDGASAGLLRMLATSGCARLLLTGRAIPRPPDDIVAMWKDGRMEWIDLEPFGRADTAELVRAALGGVVGCDTDRRIWQTSRGNPLYVREIVRSGLTRGDIQHSHGVWSWTGSGMPGRLTELVTADVNRLTETERDVLETVALAGTLPLRLLFHLAAPGDVDTLVFSGALVIDPAGSPPVARVAHPVHEEAVRALVPPGRRRMLRERVVRLLPKPDGTSLPELLRWVSWTLEAGAMPEPGVLGDAASLANQLQQPSEAIRFADLALLADPPSGVVATALAERSRAHRTLGAAEPALTDLERFRTLPSDTVSERLTAHTAITGADAMFYGRADTTGAVALLDDALARVPGDAAAVAALRGHRLAILLNAGVPGEHLSEAVRFLADDTLPLLARVRLTPSVQLALALSGRIAESVRLGEPYSCAARAPLSEATAFLCSIRSVGVLIHLLAGDVNAAESAHAYELDLNVSHTPQHRAIPGLVEGHLALARGRWPEAYGHGLVATSTLQHDDPLGLLPAVLAMSSQAAVRLGAFADAAKLRAHSNRAALHLGPSSLRWRPALLWVGLARREDDAVTEALSTAERCAAAGLPPSELDALYIATLGLAAGLPGGDGDGVAGIAERMAAVSERCNGMPRAAVMVDYARALAGDDREQAAATAVLLAQHGVWTTPPSQPVVGLTRREQEIAPLAAAGLSSRDIARRLSISTRTVESHLGRIYTKLGVSGRAELPGALSGGARV